MHRLCCVCAVCVLLGFALVSCIAAASLPGAAPPISLATDADGYITHIEVDERSVLAAARRVIGSGEYAAAFCDARAADTLLPLGEPHQLQTAASVALTALYGCLGDPVAIVREAAALSLGCALSFVSASD